MFSRNCIYLRYRYLMWEVGPSPITQRSSDFDAAADRGNCIIVQTRWEMAGDFPRPYFRIDVESVGSQMHIDLVKHPFHRTIGLLINSKCLVYFEAHALSQIEPMIVEN